MRSSTWTCKRLGSLCLMAWLFSFVAFAPFLQAMMFIEEKPLSDYFSIPANSFIMQGTSDPFNGNIYIGAISDVSSDAQLAIVNPYFCLLRVITQPFPFPTYLTIGGAAGSQIVLDPDVHPGTLGVLYRDNSVTHAAAVMFYNATLNPLEAPFCAQYTIPYLPFTSSIFLVNPTTHVYALISLLEWRVFFSALSCNTDLFVRNSPFSSLSASQLYAAVVDPVTGLYFVSIQAGAGPRLLTVSLEGQILNTLTLSNSMTAMAFNAKTRILTLVTNLNVPNIIEYLVDENTGALSLFFASAFASCDLAGADSINGVTFFVSSTPSNQLIARVNGVLLFTPLPFAVQKFMPNENNHCVYVISAGASPVMAEYCLPTDFP